MGADGSGDTELHARVKNPLTECCHVLNIVFVLVEPGDRA